MIRVVRLPFLLGPRGVGAQVLLPETIFVKRGVVLGEHFLAHEVAHVRQLRRLGLLGYWFTYLRLWLKHGYASHPMELEAEALAHEPEVRAEARSLIARYGIR